MPAAVNRSDVLDALRKDGTNLKGWCEKHKYGYRNASDVLRGINKGTFGQGKEIAEKLNAVVVRSKNKKR